jgi:hypothetical protein
MTQRARSRVGLNQHRAGAAGRRLCDEHRAGAARRRWDCALVAACALGACEPSAAPLHWQLQWKTPALANRAAVLEARIAKGGCASTDIAYASRFAPGKQAGQPPTLASGKYGFAARAQDEQCQWYASGCVEIELPEKHDRTLVVHLAELIMPALDCDYPSCDSPQCRGSSESSGGLPRPLDAGADDMDAGRDRGDDDGGADHAAARPVRFELEAESADPLLAPLVRVDDAAASGGAYISYPWDPALTLEERQALKRATPPSDASADGIAVYMFDVPMKHDYRVWGRVITPSLDEDSFWLRFDDAGWIQWNDIAHLDQWHWVDLRPFEQRTDRYLFPMAAGHHTLRIAYRELGARLDKLVFASNPDFVPGD